MIRLSRRLKEAELDIAGPVQERLRPKPLAQLSSTQLNSRRGQADQFLMRHLARTTKLLLLDLIS